ncbi:hypothetical protein MNBD_GAMMA12-2745 [hydrothermal vent metagenome]|uniref:Microbial-type PARG catalytic domain-containing protein n=1 Tax=hydrothermal vent metagenome TaxID=652676 RepID=A0A3B0Y0A5_9ZZZZ
MSLKGIAKETLKILSQGGFHSSEGSWVAFDKEQNFAELNTRLYLPDSYSNLEFRSSELSVKPKFELMNKTTQQAAYQLVVTEGINDLVLLNYASARNAGGGFINGAKAQEEDLCRCSGLYPCLTTQALYYEINRENKSLLYTDHIIYSPQVPWFRVSSRRLLDDFFLASVITAPAPNAGEFLRQQQGTAQEVADCLYQRCGKILAIARDNGHRNLLLGAWGCGVFCNDPNVVANMFSIWLESETFNQAFDRVVFGLTGQSKPGTNFKAFEDRVLENNQLA